MVKGPAKKGKSTKKVWYYQLDPERNLGKTNPLNDDDLKEFIELQKTSADSDKSWSVDVKDVDESTFDLSVKNPMSTSSCGCGESFGV